MRNRRSRFTSLTPHFNETDSLRHWLIKVLNGSWISILLLPPIPIFSILIPLRLDQYYSISWFQVFYPLWAFNLLLLIRTLSTLYAFYACPHLLYAQIPAQSVFATKRPIHIQIFLLHDSHIWRAFNAFVCISWTLLGVLLPAYLEHHPSINGTFLFLLFLITTLGVITMSFVLDAQQEYNHSNGSISEDSESHIIFSAPSRRRNPAILSRTHRILIIIFMVAILMTGFLWWLRLERHAEPSYLVIFMPILAAHLVFIVLRNPNRVSGVPREFRGDMDILSVGVALVMITFEILLIERLSNQNSTMSFTIAFIPLFLITFSILIFTVASCCFQSLIHIFPNLVDM